MMVVWGGNIRILKFFAHLADIEEGEEDFGHHQDVGPARRFPQDVQAVDPGGEDGHNGQEPADGSLQN